MITDTLTVETAVFEARTGWELKPEGACKGEVCIPLADPPTGDTVQLDDLAEAMGLPLVHDENHGLWALGPEALSGRALSTAVAPNLTLPTLEGDTFELASLRGKKVFLYAWSPY
jgi:hypothetical protein